MEKSWKCYGKVMEILLGINGKFMEKGSLHIGVNLEVVVIDVQLIVNFPRPFITLGKILQNKKTRKLEKRRNTKLNQFNWIQWTFWIC